MIAKIGGLKVIAAALALLVLCVGLVAPVAAQTVATPQPIVPTLNADTTAQQIINTATTTTQNTVDTIEGFFERLTRTPESTALRVLMVIGGVILLFAGWRIYDFIIIIAGFLIGASIAASLVASSSTLVMLLVILIGGFIGAALSVVVYQIAVFLIGLYIGVLLTQGIATALALTPVSPIVLLIGGIIGGVIAIGLSFELLVLLSALAGAQMLTTALGLSLIWTIIFVIAGVVVQLGLIRALKYDFRRHRRPYSYYRRVTS
jgi:hypothetical protein